MSRKKRRQHTPKFKTMMVGKAFQLKNIEQAAKIHNLAHSVLRSWCRNPIYGGRLDAFSMEHRGRNGVPPADAPAYMDPVPEPAADAELPTKPASGRRRSAMPLVATRYVCPHCGGPIKDE